MSNKFDHEKAAKEDIVARPEVTGEGNLPAKEPVKSGKASAKISAKSAKLAGKNSVDSAKLGGKEPPNAAKLPAVIDAGPDDLELSAGKVISNTVDELKQLAGMKPDADFSRLLSEALGGTFAALRMMTGRWWVRLAFAGGALGFAFLPPVCRYLAAKKAGEETK